MSEIIKTNENINSIALAYYDEEDEVLKEVNEDNLYFSLSPYSTKYKRLYLIGDLIYRDIIKVEAFVTSFGEITNYEVKLNLLDAFIDQMIQPFFQAEQTIDQVNQIINIKS